MATIERGLDRCANYPTHWGRNRTALQPVAGVDKPPDESQEPIPHATGYRCTSPRRNYAAACSNLKQKQQKMILNDKQDCIESIARILEKTSAWRRSTAAKFPGDPRNTKAAEMLNQLAIDAANLTDEQWTDLKPYFGWASQTWRDGLLQAARLVGFSHRDKSFNSFVRSVVRQLPPLSVAA